MQTRSSLASLVVLLFVPLGASAQLVEPNSGMRACTKCSDLCYLVDEYWQKERGIEEVWKTFAASTSTPGSRGKALKAAGVTDLNGFYDYIYGKALPKAWENRQLPCKAIQDWEKEPAKPPQLPPEGDGTGLETKVSDDKCEILFGGEKLEGDNEKKWRARHVCKASSDAELEHEKVHQKICRDTYARDGSLAPRRMQQIQNIAESELQAWKKHRDLLREEILKLAANCGWVPTDRQKQDPDSVPTEAQTKKMEEQGWKAFTALTGAKP